MNKILILLSLVLLTACGPSQEDKETIAAVTCSIIGETRGMDAAIRVREMNKARVEIGGEPFLGGDDAIKESLEWGLCKELVLNESYDETLQPLKDAKRERESIAFSKLMTDIRIAGEKQAEKNRIAEEKQRIADSKPTVEERFHLGKLRSRTNYQSKNDGGEKHGAAEKYHDNGQLKSTENYKDGNRDGLWETYDENGQLKSKRNYKDGKEHGFYESYYKNGQLESKRNYIDGKEHGFYESYYKNGQLESKGNYKDGNRDGSSEYYYKNGKLWSKINYKDGKQIY